MAHRQQKQDTRGVRRRRRELGAVVLLLLLSGSAVWWRQQEQPGPSPVYAALGASDAVGVGTSRPAEEGWVPRVYAALPVNSSLLNVGISGATLGDVLTQELPVALDAHPRWISIWPGINDLRAGVSLATFRHELDILLAHWSQGQAAGAGATPTTVIVLTIPDLRPVPAFRSIAPAELDATVRAWNQAITSAAGQYGAVVVDLYTHGADLLAHPGYLSDDGFHPSALGYARIADLVVATLRQGGNTNAR